MRWLKSAYLPTCLLSAATATVLATPFTAWAQSSSSLQETAVQRELRRLYEESGREMPEIQQEIQLQRPQPAASVQQPIVPTTAPPTVAAPVAAPTTISPSSNQIVVPNGSQANPGGAAPAASAPRPGSQNPVVRFFKRLIPGGQSKPEVASSPAAVTRPTTPPAAPPQEPVVPRTAQTTTPSYAPYSGQQPRRLTSPEVAGTLPPSANPLPPSPAQLPPQPAQAAAKSTAQPVAPVNAAPPAPLNDFAPFAQTTPVPTTAPPRVTAQPTTDSELVFAPPLIVEDEAQEFAAPDAGPALEPELPAPEMPVAAIQQDFPDPFPEVSEEEADDELDIEGESPFVGLTLDDEPDFGPPQESTDAPEQMPVAEAEEFDPLLDLPVLPAPAGETSSIAAKKNLPPLPIPQSGDDQNSNTTPVALAPEMPVESDPLLTVPELLPAPASAPVAMTTQPEPSLPVVPLEKSEAPIARPISHQPASDTEAKMALIRDRGGMKGLKGFCPVTLRDDRELRDAQSEISGTYRGQKFHFASEAAKAKFETDAARYVPAAYGADVVVLIRDKDVAEGSLDHAAWYKGKLYLFSSAETHEAFVNDPAKYSAPAGLE